MNQKMNHHHSQLVTGHRVTGHKVTSHLLLCHECANPRNYNDCHILRSSVLMGARRFHSLHHSSNACPKNYGFTSASWDLVFGTCDAATKRGWAILWIPIPVLPLLLHKSLERD